MLRFSWLILAALAVASHAADPTPTPTSSSPASVSATPAPSLAPAAPPAFPESYAITGPVSVSYSCRDPRCLAGFAGGPLASSYLVDGELFDASGLAFSVSQSVCADGFVVANVSRPSTVQTYSGSQSDAREFSLESFSGFALLSPSPDYFFVGVLPGGQCALRRPPIVYCPQHALCPDGCAGSNCIIGGVPGYCGGDIPWSSWPGSRPAPLLASCPTFLPGLQACRPYSRKFDSRGCASFSMGASADGLSLPTCLPTLGLVCPASYPYASISFSQPLTTAFVSTSGDYSVDCQLGASALSPSLGPIIPSADGIAMSLPTVLSAAVSGPCLPGPASRALFSSSPSIPSLPIEVSVSVSLDGWTCLAVVTVTGEGAPAGTRVTLQVFSSDFTDESMAARSLRVPSDGSWPVLALEPATHDVLDTPSLTFYVRATTEYSSADSRAVVVPYGSARGLCQPLCAIFDVFQMDAAAATFSRQTESTRLWIGIPMLVVFWFCVNALVAIALSAVLVVLGYKSVDSKRSFLWGPLLLALIVVREVVTAVLYVLAWALAWARYVSNVGPRPAPLSLRPTPSAAKPAPASVETGSAASIQTAAQPPPSARPTSKSSGVVPAGGRARRNAVLPFVAMFLFACALPVADGCTVTSVITGSSSRVVAGKLLVQFATDFDLPASRGSEACLSLRLLAIQGLDVGLPIVPSVDFSVNVTSVRSSHRLVHRYSAGDPSCENTYCGRCSGTGWGTSPDCLTSVTPSQYFNQFASSAGNDCGIFQDCTRRTKTSCAGTLAGRHTVYDISPQATYQIDLLVCAGPDCVSVEWDGQPRPDLPIPTLSAVLVFRAHVPGLSLPSLSSHISASSSPSVASAPLDPLVLVRRLQTGQVYVLPASLFNSVGGLSSSALGLCQTSQFEGVPRCPVNSMTYTFTRTNQCQSSGAGSTVRASAALLGGSLRPDLLLSTVFPSAVLSPLNFTGSRISFALSRGGVSLLRLIAETPATLVVPLVVPGLRSIRFVGTAPNVGHSTFVVSAFARMNCTAHPLSRDCDPLVPPSASLAGGFQATARRVDLGGSAIFTVPSLRMTSHHPSPGSPYGESEFAILMEATGAGEAEICVSGPDSLLPQCQLVEFEVPAAVGPPPPAPGDGRQLNPTPDSQRPGLGSFFSGLFGSLAAFLTTGYGVWLLVALLALAFVVFFPLIMTAGRCMCSRMRGSFSANASIKKD